MKDGEIPETRPRPRLDVLTLEPSWLVGAQHIMPKGPPRPWRERKKVWRAPWRTKLIAVADTPPIALGAQGRSGRVMVYAAVWDGVLWSRPMSSWSLCEPGTTLPAASYCMNVLNGHGLLKK